MNKYAFFNQLFSAHYPKIFRLCKGYFKGNEDRAADAAQETFIKVWQNLDSFKGEAKIDTWIYRIAVNTCLTKLRKKDNSISIEALDLSNQENSDSGKEEQYAKMYDCISKLPSAGRMIIIMTIEGLDYSDIAQIIGISEQNLRVRIHRIKQQLIKCVQP